MSKPNNSGRRVVKINALAQAGLIRLLLDGELNCAELAEETGLHYVTVLQYTRELHKAGAAHIAKWEPDRRGRHTIKVYKLGRGRDAPRRKLTPMQKKQRYLDRARTAELAAVTAGRGQFTQAANGRVRFDPADSP